MFKEIRNLLIFVFLVLTVTGIVLMLHYRPVVEYAYLDVKSLLFDVAFGMFLRNMHRWASYGIVGLAMLQIFRANWVIGIILFVLTALMFLTGCMLPWDRLSIRVASLFGAPDLLNLYVLHCVVIPIALTALIIVSLRRETEPEAGLPLKSGLFLFILLMVFSLLFDAPLDGPAYFDSYTMWAVVPALIVVGLILIKRSSTTAWFVLLILFFAVSAWALYDGFVVQQPWTRYQRELKRLDLARLQAEYNKARQAFEAEDAARDRLPDPVTDESQLSLRKIRLMIEAAEIGMEWAADTHQPIEVYEAELKKWRSAEEKVLEPLAKLKKEMDAIRSSRLGLMQAVDRCESCHVAIDRAGFEGAKNPLKTHPSREKILSKHPPEKFGCTACHGGQGRAALIKGKPFGPGDFAHGFDRNSREPLLRGDRVRSSCKKCHQGFK